MTMMYDYVKNIGRNKDRQPNGIGVEIEAEFKESLDYDGKWKTPGGWRIVRDGSLRNNGYEFILEGVLNQEDAMSKVQKLLDKEMFKKFYIQNHRTSTHIHVNIQNWEKEQLLKVLFCYYLVEGLLVRVSGKGREGNLFCLRMRDADSVSDAVKHVIDDEYRKLYEKFDNFKYAALNLAVIPKLGSIEFRSFKGTNDANEINEWVSLLKELCSSAIKFESYDDIWESWFLNKNDFMQRLFPTKLAWLQREAGVDYYDLLDYGSSLVFNLITYAHSYGDRKKVSYRFPKNETVEDTEEYF